MRGIINKLSIFSLLALFPVLLTQNSFPQDTKTDLATFVVDSIEVNGNKTTDEFVITRELTFKEGDTATTEDLIYGKERIYSLDLFSFVSVDRVIEKEHNIVKIRVEESWYYYPVPFLDFRDEALDQATYGLSLSLKNLRGLSEQYLAILSFGYNPRFLLSYYNPLFLKEEEVIFGLSASYQTIENRSLKAFRKFRDLFSYRIISGQITIGKRLNLFNEVNSFFGYQYFDGPSKNFSGLTATGKKEEGLPFLGLSYTHDTRNLKQFPNSGILSVISLTHKGFGMKGAQYNIFNLDFREYRKLFYELIGKWRFSYRGTFGEQIPFYDLSYFGLSQFVRGHQNDPREGLNSFLSSLEFSYPVVKEWNFSIKLPLIPKSLTSARIGIYLKAFGDTGITYDNTSQVSLNNFYSGYGLGLTVLFIPYNTFRIEYAFNDWGEGEILLSSGIAF